MMRGKNSGSTLVAERIAPGSVGVEIGVWRGDTSELFMRRAAHLHLVDPWSVEAYGDSNEFGDYAAYLSRYEQLVGSREPQNFQRYYNRVYESVVQRFAGFPVTIHRCTSREFFGRFAGAVDWVYVDGLHSYDGCLADLRDAFRIVRTGGFLYGDDYGNKPGVTAAVRAFGKPYELLGANQYAIAC